MLSKEIKNKAISLRKKGYSLNEIVKETKIAKSTASLLLRGIKLNKFAESKLKIKGTSGLIFAHAKLKVLWKDRRQFIFDKTQVSINNSYPNRDMVKILCAMLFWAEGTKNFSGLKFTNSDPKMIKAFIGMLRKSFDLDESKFRLLIHIHEYHDKKYICKFWSDTTGIPITQFNKCYLKPHTAIRKKNNYLGCASLYYNDWRVAYELYSIYTSFASLF